MPSIGAAAQIRLELIRSVSYYLIMGTIVTKLLGPSRFRITLMLFQAWGQLAHGVQVRVYPSL
jgi:hypothetical protein